MSDIMVRKITGIQKELGDDWVFFKHGEWSFPIMILHHYEAKEIAYQILDLDGRDPVSLTDATGRMVEAENMVNLLIEQMTAIGDSDRKLPEFTACPNCRHHNEFPVTHCAECRWPPIPK